MRAHLPWLSQGDIFVDVPLPAAHVQLDCLTGYPPPHVRTYFRHAPDPHPTRLGRTLTRPLSPRAPT